MIERWLGAIFQACRSGHLELARELAECGRVIKGYGDTRARTSGQLSDILSLIERGESGAIDASDVAQWREDAMADDEGRALRRALASSANSAMAPPSQCSA